MTGRPERSEPEYRFQMRLIRKKITVSRETVIHSSIGLFISMIT